MPTGSLPYSNKPRNRTHPRPFVPWRSLLRVVTVLIVVLLFYCYHRCSPYVCPPRAANPLSYPTGYPREGSSSADGDPQSSGKQRSSGEAAHTGYESPPKNLLSKATIVAAMKGDNTSWLHEYFPDWDHNVYVMNDPYAELTVAKNKGRESMAYLSYLIDNYHDLPQHMVFLHSLRYQWHNEDPMYGMCIIANRAGNRGIACSFNCRPLLILRRWCTAVEEPTIALRQPSGLRQHAMLLDNRMSYGDTTGKDHHTGRGCAGGRQ